MDPLYYEYYDRIHSGKDYRAEVDTVLGIFQNIVGRAPKRILDVGCGSGNHALIFAERGCEVVGIDIDSSVIEIANQKRHNQASNQPEFFCKDVSQLEAGKFDLVVSLFNVINYINQMEELETFFQAINQHLVEPGLFIFDCWNGLAAILDPPRNKDSQLIVGDERIEIATRPHVALMEQSVTVDNHISVTSSDGDRRQFSFYYQHTLWTPWHLRNLLRLAGFEILNVSAWMQSGVAATPESWKIMFTCRKASAVTSRMYE